MDERGAVRRIWALVLFIGVICATSCGGAASTAVTCTNTLDATNTVTLSTSCTDPNTAISLTLSPITVYVSVVTSLQFTSTLSNGTNTVTIWNVNGIQGGNSTVGTIDSTGKYTAPSQTPSPATVTINATSYEDNLLTIPATVTVIAPPTVTLSPGNTTAAAGGQIPFTATVTGETTTSGAVVVNTNVLYFVNGVLGGNAVVGTISGTGVYTAPATPPLGQVVTVSAESQAFPLSSASSSVTVSGYNNASLKGPYAFSMSGESVSGASPGPFFRAGSFTADGNGNLTTGLEDINAFGGVPTTISFAGTYTVGTDGRGSMTFNDGFTPATFNFVIVNNNQVQMIGFDASGTATGQASLQDGTSFAISGVYGTYAFGLTGVDGSSNALSQIGIFKADGAGNITSGLVDVNDNGTPSATPAAVTGTYMPDPNPSFSNSLNSNGRGLLTLQFGGNTLHFAFYIVSRGSVNLVGIDPTQSVAGTGLQQAPNGVFNLASLEGNYAFQLAGSNAAGGIASAGVLSANGTGKLTAGVLDEDSTGTVSSIPSITNGTYTVASSGRGTATFTTTGRTYTLVFYLGPTGGATLQETDSGITSAGALVQQQTVPSPLNSAIQGTYAFNSSGFSGGSTQVYAGHFTSTGAGVISPGGVLDVNTAGTLTPGTAVSGMYAVAAPGRGGVTLSPAPSFAAYYISATKAFTVGLDSGKVASGQLNRQY
jgi:hypothetical protein